MHDLMTNATGNEKALGNRGYSVPGRAMGANLLMGLFYRAYQMVAMQKRYADVITATIPEMSAKLYRKSSGSRSLN